MREHFKRRIEDLEAPIACFEMAVKTNDSETARRMSRDIGNIIMAKQNLELNKQLYKIFSEKS